MLMHSCWSICFTEWCGFDQIWKGIQILFEMTLENLEKKRKRKKIKEKVLLHPIRPGGPTASQASSLFSLVGWPSYPLKQRACPLLLCLANGRGSHVSRVAFLAPWPSQRWTPTRPRYNPEHHGISSQANVSWAYIRKAQVVATFFSILHASAIPIPSPSSVKP
jgi:hypothetical protein